MPIAPFLFPDRSLKQESDTEREHVVASLCRGGLSGICKSVFDFSEIGRVSDIEKEFFDVESDAELTCDFRIAVFDLKIACRALFRVRQAEDRASEDSESRDVESDQNGQFYAFCGDALFRTAYVIVVFQGLKNQFGLYLNEFRNT